MTTALIQRVICDIPGCKKDYKNRNYMLNHIRNYHAKAGNEVQSPLGIFPSSNPARVLFDDDNEEDASTQGNSRGEINSPKVISVTSFQCGVCNIPFDTNEEAIHHMKDVHKKNAIVTSPPSVVPSPATSPPPSPASSPAPTTPDQQSLAEEVAAELNTEEEVLVAAATEEDELYKELFLLTQSIGDPEIEIINEKLDRLKTVMAKKTTLQNETTKQVVKLKNKLDVENHNCAMMKEVTERQTEELVVARQETEKSRKEIKIHKDKLKKEQEVLGKEIKTLRENNAEIIKENSDLKIRLSTKQSIIEALKETAEAAEGNAEVEVIEPNVTLGQESQFHQCNACNKMFKESDDLERHITAKHEEKQCTYCDKICSNEQELVKHHSECIDIGVANFICNKCKDMFTRQGLNRHKQNCHGAKQYYECSECGEMRSSSNAVRKHKDKDHPMLVVRSKEVCHHWRRGHCAKGDRCLYSHVGHQNQENSARRGPQVPACRNGSDCDWLKRGICSYYHPRVGVQKTWVNKKASNEGGQVSRSQGSRQEVGIRGPRQESRSQGHRQERRSQGPRQEGRSQGSRQGGRSQGPRQESRGLAQPDRLPCKFDGRCERIPNCPWIHSLEDFPPIQRRSNNVLRNISQQRRH